MQSEWGHASRAQDLRRRIGSADVFTHGAVSMDAPSEVSVPELTIVGDPLPRTRRVLGRVPFPVQVKTALVAADLVATIADLLADLGGQPASGRRDGGLQRRRSERQGSGGRGANYSRPPVRIRRAAGGRCRCGWRRSARRRNP